jgi:hypothetical protein
MRAIEATGLIDQQGQLHLDQPLSVNPSRVRVILLLPDADEADHQEWLQAAAKNPAFDFLNAPEEDVYTLADGQPFHDEG